MKGIVRQWRIYNKYSTFLKGLGNRCRTTAKEGGIICLSN
jgi:hypothetical protein